MQLNKGLSSTLLHGNVDQCILTIWWSGVPDNVAAVRLRIYGVKEEWSASFMFLLTDQSRMILGIMEMITGKSLRAKTRTTKTPFTRDVESQAE